MSDKRLPDNDDQSSAAMAALTSRVAETLADLHAGPLEPGLYLVATPIGNLADITLRALSVLAQADVIYCEDTRHSSKLLDHFSIKAAKRPFHDHNEQKELERAISELQSGKRIAVISDAGTPLVSDPGFRLVRAAAAEGIPVCSIPGPSAVLAAVTSSGLPTDAFHYAGFLPPKQAARMSRLRELASFPTTLVIFEAPHRIGEALADMVEVFGDRDAVIARELTKRHEEIARGTLRELREQFAGRPLKGEVVIVVGAAAARAVDDEEITERLVEAMSRMRLKDAANAVADELGIPKGRAYTLGLKVKDSVHD